MRGTKSTVLMSMTGVLLLGACGGESGTKGHSFGHPTTAIEPAAQARAETMLISERGPPGRLDLEPDDEGRDTDEPCVDGNGPTETGRAFSDVLWNAAMRATTFNAEPGHRVRERGSSQNVVLAA